MAMFMQTCDALIPVQTAKKTSVLLEVTHLLSYIATRGRQTRRRIVTAPAEQNIPYYMSRRTNMVPYKGWTSSKASF